MNKTAPLHPKELERLEELKRYKILDTEPEALYSNIVQMAAQICDVPICAISFVDKERQWFKGYTGMTLDKPETSRDIAFCAYTILETDSLIVEDATKDERFAQNPLVTGHADIRFYAGIPLVSSQGLPLGALCVLDKKPRKLTPYQKESLRLLAKQVTLLNEQRIMLQTSRLKLFQKKNAISHMNYGVMAVDAKGTVMFTNEAFVDLFKLGVRVEEIEGKNYADLIRHFGSTRMRNPEKLVRNISAIISKHEAIYGDEIMTAEGRIVECDFIPVDFEGSFIGYLWTYRDVTEKRHQAKVMEVALKKAEELTQLKSQFLANMSHEIRTPLNGIIGMSSLLIDSILDKKQRDLTSNIRECGESLLEIVNDILDYSKIEANKLELSSEPFTVQSCLDQSLYILDHKASQKGLNLSYKFLSEIPVAVQGDAGRLKQILVNLIGNAVKFTHQGHVEVLVTAHDSFDNYVQLDFAVKDTGVGIPQDRMDRLFKSFSQVDSSTSRQYGGTGLGLAISKNLCEMMNGRIKVESEVGVGTTFSFNVKLKKCAVLPLEKPTSTVKTAFSTDSMSSLKILVVDDNVINQKLAIGLLEKMGFKADVAGNGLEALKLVQQNSYDLVFMDVQMPEMSGLEATAKIRELNLGFQPTIIALTANAMREDEDKCRASGMDDYLSKPIQPKLLAEKIKMLIESKAA